MISVNEALAILQKNIPAPRIITISLDDAVGKRLAEDIPAPEPAPRYTSSAMDGYAVRWADVATVSEQQPVTLKIAGESQAGVPYSTALALGEAVRISTGAVVPAGADTVVRVEDCIEEEESVQILACRQEGQDVRHAGEEFGAGTMLVRKGQVLHARQVALLAAVGVAQLRVYDAPKVSLLITGTELAHHGDGEIKPFQVRDSNTPMLRSAIVEAGGLVISCIHVEDSLEATAAAMREALAQESDILLCSGGVSVGRHDHVKDAAANVGMEELFWKIRQKPGKPLFVARKGSTLLFGLPGNPVSAFMCYSNYVVPTLTAMQGVSYLQKTVSARAEVRIENPGKRTLFVRVQMTDEPHAVPTVVPLSRQGSHMLSSIVEADGYTVIEPGCSVQEGDLVDVVVF